MIHVCPNSKKLKLRGQVILYVGELACYLLAILGLTWTPQGQRPILQE
jgi:hypothetical protein